MMGVGFIMSKNYIDTAEAALLHTYNRYQIVLEKGEGVYLYDTNGKQYLDFAAGIAVCSLGYGHPKYKEALKNQVDTLLHTSNLFYSKPVAEAAEKLKEELALGFNVQIQEIMLSEAMVQAINEAPLQNRICLVTDDVPLPRLMRDGHLNHVVEKAIELGLDPLTAIRCATINAADRLRLNDVGAICPGRKADIQLVHDLEHPQPESVFFGGHHVFEKGAFLVDFPEHEMPESMHNTMDRKPMKEDDFRIVCDVPETFKEGTARVNIIYQDGIGVRTKRKEALLPLKALNKGKAEVITEGYLTMAVCNRYGKDQMGLGLVEGVGNFCGAVALTYGHDCHNLTVYGSDPKNMAVAANAIIEAGGGICVVEDGMVLNLIPLPLAGLLCETPAELLLERLEMFLHNCERLGFRHSRPLSFFTTMPLAVSPEIKCTDKGLLDVANKKFMSIVEEVEEI